MKQLNFTYQGTTYHTEAAVRAAVWKSERKALPTSVTDWERFGVTYSETEIKLPKVEISAEEKARIALENAKSEREAAVEKIIVEVDGMAFDGDETSQARMSRICTAALISGAPTSEKVKWVLADNTVAYPTVEQLGRALILAGTEQTRLWTVPYDAEAEK